MKDTSNKRCSDWGTKNDTLRPMRGKTSVMVRMEVGKEVSSNGRGGKAESVDEETGFGDEF